MACSLWAGLTGGWGYMYITIMHIHYLGNSILSALCLSVATYHSLYPVMLLVPLSLLLYQVGGAGVSLQLMPLCVYLQDHGLTRLVGHISWFAVWSCLLMTSSYIITGSCDFLSAVYGFM